jgi:hypothetical protein
MPRVSNIKPRGGTAAQWASANPVLAARELAVETDTGVMKVGDGVTAWGSLVPAVASTVYAPADGVTDAAPAIQAHLDTAMTFGVKSVVIPPKTGTYMLGSPLYAENVTIQAYGATLKAMTTLAGAMLTCRNQKYAVLAPTSLTGTPSTTGGTLAASTHWYVVSAVTAAGETPVSLLKSATTTGATSSVSLSWTPPTVPAGGSPITGYRVYGRTRGALTRIGTTAAGVTTFVDTGAAGTGEALPSSNGSFSRTGRLVVLGGTWDSDGDNRPADINWVESGKTAGHAFDFQRIDDLIVRDVTINNAKCWSIAVADFGHVVTENIKFASLRDGIHVVGPGKSWTCRSVRGSAPSDDMLGVSLAEWDWMAVSYGSIDKVLIEDVFAETAGVYAFLRVLGAAGTTLRDLTVRGVRGSWIHTSNGGLRIFDNQVSTHQLYPDGTDVDRLTIEDVYITTLNTNGNPLVYLAGRNLGDVRINGVKASSTTAQECVQISNSPGTGTTCTIGELTVGGLSRNASGRQNLAISSSSVVTRIKVVEPPLVEDFTPGTSTWTKRAGAKTVEFRAWGPGGGGGSGRRGAAGSVRTGGAGGGPGGYAREIFPASVLPATMTVVVTAGGAGGVAVAVDDTNGNAGSSPSATQVRDGASDAAASIRFGAAGGIGGGAGGTGAAPGGAAGAGYSVTGSAGAGSSATGGAGTQPPASNGGPASGGGSGAGLTSADVAAAGGIGGNTWIVNNGTVSAGASGTAPTLSNTSQGGLGGAGGGSSVADAGGNGSTGAGWGAGGGGGAGSVNGQNSGAGGAGTDGHVTVITYF